MDDMFFNTVKDLFGKDPKLEEDFMQKIGLVYGLNTFRNIPEAMQSMVQGNVIVGFSVAKKDDNIGIEFDNAYRIKDGMLESYTFTPNLTKRPFKVFPHQRMIVFGMDMADWCGISIGSLHHGFILGDGVIDMKNSLDFSKNKF